ncbi:hypothetical protein [Pedobacter sp.]|uniref:hypothetical protein n=1 Tax=Pedobacter sp. TaxID=1411316 RepID=UPI0031D2A140
MLFKKLFSKREYARIEYSNLQNYHNKDKYFVRLKPWDWLSEKEIYVASVLNDKPTMITMHFWSQEIYLNANGQITVSELFSLAEKQYLDCRMDVPKDLDLVLLDSLDGLENELKIIQFVDKKTQLPNDLQNPMSNK